MGVPGGRGSCLLTGVAADVGAGVVGGRAGLQQPGLVDGGGGVAMGWGDGAEQRLVRQQFRRLSRRQPTAPGALPPAC